jgi:hypothetical protein
MASCSHGGVKEPAGFAPPDVASTAVQAVVVLLVFLGIAALRFYDKPEREKRFADCYATVNARVIETLAWTILHALRGAWRAPRRPRVLRAALGLGIVAITLLIPAGAVCAGGWKGLQAHALAFGFSALVWGCVVEGAMLYERTRAQNGERAAWPVPLWFAAAGLAFLDLCLALVFLSHWLTGSAYAASAGAGFVALADELSIIIGFGLSLKRPYLLADPAAPDGAAG